MTEQRVIHRLATNELSAQQIGALRELLWAAFADHEGGMTEDDWQHALGGTHFIAQVANEIVAHASVVDRTLHIAGAPIRTGYVEAVAATPRHQGQGHGSALMREVNELIRSENDLGALGTGSQGFYEKLGWQVWPGPTAVMTAEGQQPTPEEDGYIMFLTTPSTPALDLNAAIVCEWRPGDVW